ncbi:MAG: hypothetical protein QOF42_782 [Gammaproteobacteria bacterium]|nr:hypothetical protein [Gammaproteobacteria bacterium]
MHHDRSPAGFALLCAAALTLLVSAASGAPNSEELVPQTPAAFMPGGMLGIQLGGSWQASKHNPSLQHLSCQSIDGGEDFDEVCFFRASSSTRVAGAEIHDGFIVRKDDHVALVGTGISIKNADDPLAESVVQSFQSQIHSAYQHTGDNVLFVKLPARHMSAAEMQGFSKTAPVLLVQLESKSHELAVLYGYLAPVNTFGSLAAD